MIEATFSCTNETPPIVYNPNKRLTPNLEDHFNYGDGFIDVEDYCMHREASWTKGSANSQDWSVGGKQWY